MDISKVLLLIRELEHGTSPFLFQIVLSLKINNQHVQFDNNLSAFSIESSLQCILSIALYCFFYRS